MKKLTLPFRRKGYSMIGLYTLTLVLFSFMFQASMAQLPCSQNLMDELGLQLLPCQGLNTLDCGFCESCDLEYICVAQADGFQLDHFDQSIECDPSLNHVGFDDYWFTYDWSVNGVTVNPPNGQCLNVTSFNFGDRVCVNVEVRAAGTGISTPPICFIPLGYELEDLCDTTGSVCCDERSNSIVNGGFNASCQHSCSGFAAGCVPNWGASHGSPHNPNGTAYMWARSELSEGIVNNAGPGTGGLHTQEEGTYAVSFTITGGSTGDAMGSANVFLCNGLGTGGTLVCAGEPHIATPANSQLIWSENIANLPTGETLEVCCVFRSERDFSQVWIIPQFTAGDRISRVFMTVDDVCISPGEGQNVGYGCISRRRITGSTILSGENLIEEGFFSLFPNPAKEAAHFNYRMSTVGTAALFNLTGAKVWEQMLDPNNQQVDIPLQKLPNGIYLMQVEADGIRVYQKKLVINE